MHATALQSASAETRRLRDEHLTCYLAAYDEYTTCHVELESHLKQSHLSLSRARRDLASRSSVGSPTFGATLYPREFSALLTLSEEAADDDDDQQGAARKLRIDTREDEPAAAAAAAAGGAAAAAGAAPAAAPATPSAEAAERATAAELERWGIGSEMVSEIAAAVTDTGEDVAMACGDVIAIEHRDGTTSGASVGASAYSARSAMSFSAGGLDDLKRSQFRAMVSSGGAAEGGDEAGGDRKGEQRPRPQVKPSNSRDPLRWFTVLPPPSLRQAQKGFRSSVDLAVRCANAQARMQEARERYEALLPPRGAAAAAAAGAGGGEGAAAPAVE